MMNYLLHYEKLIANAKLLHNSRVQDRKENKRYYEMHHIIPRFLGGDDSVSNLVLLTFREHFIAHLLLYKNCKKENNKIYAAFGSLVQMSNIKRKGDMRDGIDALLTSRKFETFRKTFWDQYTPEQHGMYGKTHSKEARKIISDCRKGTMPAKVLATGQRLGSVPVNHKKVLSGEWVHITHGITKTDEQKAKYPSTSGKNNSNYSGQEDEDILEFTKEFCKNHLIEGYFIKNLWVEYCKRNGFSFIINKRFQGKGFEGLLESLRDDGIQFEYQMFGLSKEIKIKSQNSELGKNKISHEEYIKNIRKRKGKE